jgi:NADH:ubiquinone oxidoreductase subunit C
MPQQVPQEQGKDAMIRLPENIQAELAAAAPTGIDYSSTTSPHGAVTAWCSLANSEDLLAVGKMLLALPARLAMVSALQLPAPAGDEEEQGDETEDDSSSEAHTAKPAKEIPKTFGGTLLDGTSYEIDYHFVVGGDFLTVIAYVPTGGSVPSLTPYFRAADWPEREIMENYALVVRDHPDPRRLFLDSSIDAAVLERLIPYSTLVNAASTKALWDKVLAAKGGAS